VVTKPPAASVSLMRLVSKTTGYKIHSMSGRWPPDGIT